MQLSGAILDQLPIRVYFKDQDGRFAALNRAAVAALGATDEAAALGTTDHDYFGPDHADRARADERRVVETGAPILDQREREVWRDGRVSWVLTTKLPWYADDGVTVRGVVGLSKDVTAEVEETARYRHLLDAAPNLIFVKGHDLRFRYANRAVAEALGRPVEEIVGRTDDDLIADPAQVAEFRADDLRVLHGPDGEVLKREVLTRVSGERVCLSTRKVKYYPTPGADPQVLGVATDVTEQVAAREAERREQEMLRNLMDNVRDGIFFKDTAGRFTRVNRELARLVAVPAEAIVGLTDFDLFDPAFAAASAAEEQEIISTGRPREGIVRRAERTADGPRWRLVSKAPVTAGERVVGIVGISKDITALKAAEQKLRDAEQRLEQILDAIPQCVFVKDRTLRYTMVNRALLERHGLTDPGQLLGRTDHERPLAPGEANRYRETDLRAMSLRSGEKLTFTEPQVLSGERRLVETTKMPLPDGAGGVVGVLGVLHDITRELEDERLRFQVRIGKSIRHCLKNWLSVAEGSLPRLETQVPALPGVERWRKLRDVIGRLKRAADLATNLAAADRLDPAQMSDVSVSELVRRVVAAHDDHRLSLGPLPQVPACRGSVDHLENAVMELIANAREFTPEGGQIDVWVDVDGPAVRVHVRDSGPGIPERLRGADLFTGAPPPNPKRTGMGLAYVGEVVRNHPGASAREIGVGPGAHFILELRTRTPEARP